MIKIYGGARELRQIVTGEAIEALTAKPVKMTTLERVKLLAEADGQVRGMPQPLQYGNGLMYVLERASLPVKPYDLLMGRIAEEVPDAEGEAFIQGVRERYARRTEPWHNGAQPPWIFDQGHCSFYWKDAVKYGLSGLQSKAEEALAACARRSDDRTRCESNFTQYENNRTRRGDNNALYGDNRTRRGDNDARRGDNGALYENSSESAEFLEGAILVYHAIRRYLRRYGDAAERAGLGEAAEACRNAADRAPQTFREALQMLWAIMLVYCSMLATNPTLTYGHMDSLLYPLYRRDLDEGRLTREEAGLLILDFYCKNNLNMGRGEHQLSHGDEELSTGWLRNLNFDAPQYLILGGCGEDGAPAANDLTLLFAEQVQPKFKNPVIVIQYTKGMAEQFPEIWRSFVGSMRSSASMMAYNDANVKTAFRLAGAGAEDAATYEHYGCNWPALPGLEGGGCGHKHLWAKRPPPAGRAAPDKSRVNPDSARAAGANYDNLAGVFMRALKSVPAGETPANIDYFYNEIASGFRAYMRGVYERALLERETLFREAPGPLQYRDCFEKKSIKAARSYLCGAAKYFSVIHSYYGFATAVDCLTALDALLYKEKKTRLPELAEALERNFEGCENIRRMCLAAPKLGGDDELSNRHGRRLLTALTDAVYGVQREFAERGAPFILIKQCIETDTVHIKMGRETGATPDGRLAGTPLSQNCQPSVGASINGVTARLRAMARLPLERIASGAQNLSIQPRLFAGEKGLGILSSLISTYFELGGLQLQVSAAEVSDMLDAQLRPELHRDLTVRITGYSAVFVDMNRTAQDDVIRREL